MISLRELLEVRRLTLRSPLRSAVAVLALAGVAGSAGGCQSADPAASTPHVVVLAHNFGPVQVWTDTRGEADADQDQEDLADVEAPSSPLIPDVPQEE